MTNRTTFYGLIAMGALSLLAYFWFYPAEPQLTQAPATPQPAAMEMTWQAVRADDAPSTAAPTGQIAEQSAARKIFKKYIDRSESFPALLHHAIWSKDPLELEVAKLYLESCGSLPASATQGQLDKGQARLAGVDPTTKVGRARDRFVAFCAHMVGPITGLDRNLIHSFFAARHAVFGENGAMHANLGSTAAAVRDAAQQKSSPLLMSRLSGGTIEEQNQFMAESGLLSLEEQKKWPIAYGAISSALADAACRRWGDCDEEARQMGVCRSTGLCGDEPLAAKLARSYEQDKGLGPKFGFKGSLPDWQEFVSRSERFLDKLGGGG
ncbi:hypothetical protein [Inhella gelatinilytica]|uniref:Uncharacterized protein n=1 Tax=Inhella gelatinilytica TaxID=2795030 RepID=A0A931IY87_9BURK|nr:hypothetical protein [Inhella gelatinilytica]MBH9552031.1 hypothetical protein [Inhella gelatinilytica]